MYELQLNFLGENKCLKKKDYANPVRNVQKFMVIPKERVEDVQKKMKEEKFKTRIPKVKPKVKSKPIYRF